jgi:glutamyl-tRNA reductase
VRLLLVGASHRTAPLELRERLDFCSRGLDEAVKALAARPLVGEGVIISTCNRAELYVVSPGSDRTTDHLMDFIAEFHDLPADRVRPHLYALVDSDAARHLFRVASGLDSLVVGEPQILGQVKEAFATATTAHTSGPLLNKLFHWAFGVGKRVRSETALAEGAVSVSYAAVSLARKIFGNLAGRRVLVVGTGEMGRLAAIHLKGQGVTSVTIASRTLANAQQLAEEVGATVVGWDSIQQGLVDADIVVTATGASTPIFTKAQVAAAVPGSRTRPLFIIDIAVPRDVDPAAAEIEQVFLYNIDDLQAIVRENIGKRGTELARAEQIVEDEVRKFESWHRARSAIPTVVRLRQRFESIRTSELARLESKLATLPPDARAKVEDVTRLLVEKLLLRPTEQLKSVGDDDLVGRYADLLTKLFGLEDAPPPPDAEDDPEDRT